MLEKRGSAACSLAKINYVYIAHSERCISHQVACRGVAPPADDVVENDTRAVKDPVAACVVVGGLLRGLGSDGTAEAEAVWAIGIVRRPTGAIGESLSSSGGTACSCSSIARMRFSNASSRCWICWIRGDAASVSACSRSIRCWYSSAARKRCCSCTLVRKNGAPTRGCLQFEFSTVRGSVAFLHF